MSLFLNGEGVKGEASDANHPGWVDIRCISWEVNRKITSNTSTKGDRESANAVIGDLTLKKIMDKSSPTFFIEACCGTGKTVTIHLTKTGQGIGAETFMEYTLHNALISDYQMAAWNSDPDRPIEKIKISFTKLETRYISYNEDGLTEAPLAVAFDTATNMKI